MIKNIFLALVLLLSFANAKNTLNFATSKNVGPLNPHLYSPNEMWAQDMLYESLVEYSEDGKIVPKLAVSWRIADEGKTYVFTLREGVKFSDGASFDAKAVKLNFDAILANRDRHKWLELANILKDCEIIDDKTIALYLQNAYEPTLKELSLVRPFRFISPLAMKDANSTKDGIIAPVGTGAWKLASTKLGINDIFVKNENYWGQKPKFDEIVAKVIPDPNTKVVALQTGEVDLIYGNGQISFDMINELKKSYEVKVSEPMNTLVLALNSNKSPTNDRAVREALNLAVDKNAIANSIFFGVQKSADALFYSKLPYCDIELKPYKFDKKAANEILQKGGWEMGKDGIRYKGGKELKIELVYIGTNATFKSIGEILQAELKQIGVNLQLNADESTIFYKKQRSGDFGMIFNSTWGVPYDPVMFLASMRLPSHADYQAQLGLKDKAWIDENISEILKTFDEGKKSSLIKNVLTRLHDEAVYLPISHESMIWISNDKVGGARTSIFQNHYPFNEIYPK